MHCNELVYKQVLGLWYIIIYLHYLRVSIITNAKMTFSVAD